MTIEWTDPDLVAGVTPVKVAHVDELRDVADYTKSEIDAYGNIYQEDTGVANAYQLSISGYTGYLVGRPIYFKAAHSNTGTSTLQVNSLGAKTIYKNNNEELELNDIQTGQIVQAVYDGVNFQLVASGAPSGAMSVRFTNIVTTGSALSSIAVDISEYTITTDYLTVFINGIRIERSSTGDDNYTLDESYRVINKNSGTWPSGTRVTFVVDKYIYTTMKFTNGASLYDGTVAIYKIETIGHNAILKVIHAGEANTLATLDEDVKVPVAQIPSLGYVATSAVGAANGVAPLDANEKLPLASLPDLESDIKAKGSGTFNSSTGVTITHNLGLAASAYSVSITITSNPAGFLGEVWVIKSTNSMVVYCSGSTTSTTFDYIIV